MVLLGVVTLIMFSVIGVGRAYTLHSDLESALDQGLHSRNGIPEFSFGRDGSTTDTGTFSNGINAFSVSVDWTGTINRSEFNLTSTETTDSEVNELLEQAVTAALACDEQSGELKEYNLFYKYETSPFGWRIAFVDSSFIIDSMTNTIALLAGVWLVLMVILFAITFFMSRFVTRPVAKAWEDQQRFIADASHELKTPLTVILADTEILSKNPDKTVREQSMWLEGISAEAERMKSLTEDLLTLAQADAGVNTEQLMSKIDFSQTVEGSLLQFEAVAFERGLTIEEDIEPDLMVVGDELRLNRLLMTLLENACKYSPKPGTIDVGLHGGKTGVTLTVRNDNADGPIPAEDLEHLFDRFYRSDKSRMREGETASFGLGLSIAKSTAQMHGGDITVASDESGTTFTATLPYDGPNGKGRKQGLLTA